MHNVEELERDIQALSAAEFAALRTWLLEQDARRWDEQIETGVSAGKLDSLGDAARRSHREGKSARL